MTTQRDPRLEHAVAGAPGALFTALAQLFYTSDRYDDVHRAVCQAALKLVDGCHHASLMLRNGNTLVTAAATDEVARTADALERAVGEGPCIDAIEEEAAQLDTDLAAGSTWPGLTARLLVETPIRSMAGFRLMVDQHKVGSLNLFSDEPFGLTEASVEQGAVLAAFTSVALVADSQREQARTLREGLASNREIGKAIGLMMAFHKVDDQEAFEILRTASQQMNVKLSEIARQVVDHHNNRPRP